MLIEGNYGSALHISSGAILTAHVDAEGYINGAETVSREARVQSGVGRRQISNPEHVNHPGIGLAGSD